MSEPTSTSAWLAEHWDKVAGVVGGAVSAVVTAVVLLVRRAFKLEATVKEQGTRLDALEKAIAASTEASAKSRGESDEKITGIQITLARQDEALAGVHRVLGNIAADARATRVAVVGVTGKHKIPTRDGE